MNKDNVFANRKQSLSNTKILRKTTTVYEPQTCFPLEKKKKKRRKCCVAKNKDIKTLLCIFILVVALCAIVFALNNALVLSELEDTGACCFREAVNNDKALCIDRITRNNCTSSFGTYQGDDSECDFVKCPFQKDCAGVPFGSSRYDLCDVCDGSSDTCLDCLGRPNGYAVYDLCDICNGDSDTCLDCNGDPNGPASYDQCGICNGDGSTCLDCTGVLGGPSTYDLCDVCNGDSDTCLDCFGVINGPAAYDLCDVCDGDSDICLDCLGNPNGPAMYDLCDVCDGNSDTCLDCFNVPNGPSGYDVCGVCGGDGSSCATASPTTSPTLSPTSPTTSPTKAPTKIPTFEPTRTVEGGCCFGDFGVCLVVRENECILFPNGQYQGDGTTCQDVVCPSRTPTASPTTRPTLKPTRFGQPTPAPTTMSLVECALADILLPEESLQNLNYGRSVAVSGSLVIVGSLGEKVSLYNCTIPSTMGCNKLTEITNPETTQNNDFGFSVDIDGVLVVIGAPLDDISPDTDTGSAYVYNCSALISCVLVDQLMHPVFERESDDHFGTSVSIDGPNALVGAPGDNNIGQAYLFDCSSTISCSLVSTFTSGVGGMSGDRFGTSVSINGNTAAIGAPGTDVMSFSGAGAAYYFSLPCGFSCINGIKMTKQMIDIISGNEFFGESVSAFDGRILIGIPNDVENPFRDEGSFHAFDCSSTINCIRISKVLNPSTSAGSADADGFGISVSLHESSVLVGAHRDTNTFNVPGGLASLYDCSVPSNCFQITEISSMDTSSQDDFGFSVDIDDRVIVVGAPKRDSDDDDDQDVGAAYVFHCRRGIDPPTLTPTPQPTTCGQCPPSPTPITQECASIDDAQCGFGTGLCFLNGVACLSTPDTCEILSTDRCTCDCICRRGGNPINCL